MSTAITVSTGFARLTPSGARGVLMFIAVSVLASVCWHVWGPRIDGTATRAGAGDVALYRAVVEDVRAGSGYYTAVNQQLRERGYPTRSLFNWRTPLPHWLLGMIPASGGKAALCLLALLALGLAYELLAREGGTLAAMTGGLLLTGALLPCCLGDLYVMPSLWAGIFILLSVCLAGLERSWWAVLAGLAAALCRDLAVPVLLICGCYAAWLGQWRVALAWGAAFCVWGAYFAGHAAAVQGFIQVTDPAHPHGWIAFGGWSFLVAVAQMNAYLLIAPQLVAAIYLPLVICGFSSWNTPAGGRATLLAMSYLVAFSIVGQPFNQYWGALLAPLFCLGAGMGVVALRGLVQAAVGRFTSQRAASLSSAAG